MYWPEQFVDMCLLLAPKLYDILLIQSTLVLVRQEGACQISVLLLRLPISGQSLTGF